MLEMLKRIMMGQMCQADTSISLPVYLVKDRSSCDLPTTVGGHDLGETAAQLCSERVLLVLDFPQKETFLWVVQK